MPHTLPAALAPLAAHRQFIVCQLLPDPSRPGKTLKWPLHPRTLRRHDAHDPQAWLSHEEAAAIVETLGGRTASTGYILGFAFTASDPFWFIDIDNCHTGTGWSAEAMRIAGMVPGAAIEVSQSGRGLHIFGTYDARPDHTSAPTADLGFYTEKRFVALTCDGVTGDITARPVLDTLIAEYFPPGADVDSEGWTEEPVATWRGEPDDDKLLAKALASGSAAGAFSGRASFADLWTGNAEALGRTWPDHKDGQGRPWEATAADGALAGHLAFWTGKNCARIERLMMRDDCALRREKYDRPDREAGTYLRRTIVGAVARCTAVYGERQQQAITNGTSVGRNDRATNNIASDVGGGGLSFTAAAGGMIAATVANVESALLSDESGITIALDTFKDRLCIREGDEWRDFTDPDYGRLRAELERRGFKPVGAEVMSTVVGMVADANKFDSATVWANALIWDGVPRVTMALSRYYGVVDTPYTRASSEYLFTGLAGRCLSPGCQADMALILVGLQGERKTSAVSALAPDIEAFVGVDLAHRDDNLARQLRGKLVIELAEMRGLSQGRELEGIKDWLTRRIEEWTPKYKEFATRFKRRCICIGTANEMELLDDPTGERRWLPQMAGKADVEAIERDRDQLWAEGVAMWRAGGIRWQEAERLAKAEHHKFKVHDEWREAVVRWLNETPSVAWGNQASDVVNGDTPFSMLRLAKEALNLTPERLTMSDQKRIGKLLKGLGYTKKVVRTADVTRMLWLRV